MEDKVVFFENENVCFFSLNRTTQSKEYTFVRAYGNYHIYVSYHEVGQVFGKKIQRNLKKQLSKYNCHYVNPNNVLRFTSHEDVKRFYEEWYLPLYIEKKLRRWGMNNGNSTNNQTSKALDNFCQ